MLKIFKLISSALGNVHKIDAGVEKGYAAWKAFYELVAHLGTTTPQPAPVAVAEAAAEAVAVEVPSTEAKPVAIEL